MNATFKHRIIQTSYFVDYKMNVIKTILHLFGCPRMGNGAFMLAVEVGFDIEFDKRFCLQEKLRSEEFVLM